MHDLNTTDVKITGEKLKQYRTSLKLNQNDFAEMSGLSRNIIANIEGGRSSLSAQNVLQLNDAINNYIEQNSLKISKNSFVNFLYGFISIDEIFDDTDTSSSAVSIVANAEIMKLNNLFEKLSNADQKKILDRMEHIISMYTEKENIPTKKVFIVGDTACGIPKEANIISEPVETTDLRADFALYAVGDSMSPIINDNDIILVQNSTDIQIGDIGIFEINESGFSTDYHVTCKMLKNINGTKLTLVPLNNSYDPIIIDTSNVAVKLLGKFIGTVKNSDRISF